MRLSITLAALAATLAPVAAIAADRADNAADDSVFSLGQIIVTAPRNEGISIGESTLSAEAIYTFSRNTLDDAANLIPGVSASNSGGSRNERLIFVRGFDRFQVPLSIDGIRVYLPADNRLDYGRFLTPDIAEIQVAKGYASVLDGPGAMGGAINLVTRKPTKAIEAEVRGTLNLDRNIDHAGYNIFGLLGTKQDKWYAQASFARNFVDHWSLAGGYNPIAGSAEDGGARDFSRSRDWRVNLKAGFTPNATDEYTINFTKQKGEKNAPLHVTDPISTPLPAGAPTPRYWTWPYWNIESLYFLSTTALSDAATLKTRIYRNTFDNLLSSFDNRTQTTQSLPRAFNSYYADKAWGGSVQLDVDLLPVDTLSIAAHYRRDKHVEFQQSFRTSAPLSYIEPPQENLEDTYSVAAENRLTLSPEWTLTTGVSFDWRDLKKAQEFTGVVGLSSASLFSYPLANSDAFNFQGKLEWKPDSSTRLYASISRRSRFPTIFERFSTQFGTAASNPGLQPERATNVELGGNTDLGIFHVDAALFYSKIHNAIVQVRLLSLNGVPAPANTNRRENLGDAEYYGAELGFTARLASNLQLGANYTYTHRSFDIVGTPSNELAPVFHLTDVPTHKGFAYLDWSPIAPLKLVPSVEIASNRTTVTTITPPVYYRTGSYVLANFRADLDIMDNVTIGVTARNIFDDNYVLTDGFPEPGRSFSVSARIRY